MKLDYLIKKSILKITSRNVLIVLLTLITLIVINDYLGNIVLNYINIALLILLFYSYLIILYYIKQYVFKINLVSSMFNYMVSLILTIETLIPLGQFIHDYLFNSYPNYAIYLTKPMAIATFLLLLINPFIISKMLNALEYKRKVVLKDYLKDYSKCLFIVFRFYSIINRFKNAYLNI